MTGRNKNILLLLALGALLLCGCPKQQQSAQSEPPQVIAVDPPAVAVETPAEQQEALNPSAMPAPDFSFELASGEQVQLSSFRGKPVVLNFWAEW